VSDKRIHSVTIKRTPDADQICIRAEAEYHVLGGVSSARMGGEQHYRIETVKSSGVRASRTTDTEFLTQLEGGQLSELRRTLYSMGFSKRAISTACKDVGRDD